MVCKACFSIEGCFRFALIAELLIAREFDCSWDRALSLSTLDLENIEPEHIGLEDIEPEHIGLEVIEFEYIGL